jgi:hypothetical protein
MDVKLIKEIKNKRNELKLKVVRVMNKQRKKGLHFDSINIIYKDLLLKYKHNQISIGAKALDGNFTTLKAYSYTGDDLKYYDVDYYSSQPKEIQDKLRGYYYSTDITIKI